MALKIWLPLNGTLENKGVSDFTITNNGATIDNNGKIGKCYYFNGSTYSYISGSGINYTSLSTHFSVSLWIKFHEIISSYSEILSLAPTAGWAKIRFGMVVPSNSTVISCSVADGTNYLGNSFQTSSISLDTWTHVCFIYNNKNLELYIDGDFLKSYSTSIVPDWENISTIGIGAAANGQEKSKCYINDVRIYDHALSAKEVKEISQGLVLHYKLDDNIQTLNNCYSYPTFNTSVDNGGWNHWGRSGHVGNKGQNTDKTYIYNKQNTYSHWVSNDSTATGEYLVYQYPAFDGGYRSLQAIIKEENNKPIDETICFPDWNARNGGTPIGLWTSIVPLGDGFYLCKCEGISQDGSNDLVGIYVKPGYKIYISEAYLENDREMCSEILFPRNYIIDSSGYDNNGVITGTLEINTSDRYLVSTKFPTNTCYIKLPEITYSNFGNSYTFSWWEYMTTVNGTPMPWGFSDGNRLNFYHATNLCWNTGDGSNNPFTPTKTSASLVDNKWHHMVVTGDGTNAQLYIDGVNVGKAKTYRALTGTQIYISGWNTGTYYKMTNNSMSDFRIYATILSAEDVLDLYHTSANIDNLGGIHGFEFEEKTPNLLNPDLREWSKESNVTCVWNEETKYFDVNTNRNTSNTSRWGIFQNITVKPNTSYLFAVDMMGTGSAMGIAAQDTTTAWPSDRNTAGDTKRYYYILTTTATNTVGRVYLDIKPSINQIAHFKNIYLGEVGEIASIKQNGIFENEDMVEYNENGRITKSGELAGSNFIEK